MVAGEEAPSGDRTEMGDPKKDKNDRDGAGRRKTRAKGHAVEREQNRTDRA